jgi:hypothetical protein
MPDDKPLEWTQFDEENVPEVLTGISEACGRGECASCPGFGEHDGEQIFCVRFCHRAGLPIRLIEPRNQKSFLPDLVAEPPRSRCSAVQSRDTD